MAECYVYAFCKPDGVPYYIGKGTGGRVNQTANRPLVVRRYINKYGKNTKIIDKDISESQAFELEVFLISELGRLDDKTGILLNLTNGGEGSSNPSESSREKKSQSLVDAYSDPELRKKISDSRKTQWIEHRESMMAGINSEECKKVQSEKRKLLWQDPAYRAKMMASRALSNEKRIENIRKVKATPEHRRKLSDGLKKAWQDESIRNKFIDGMNEPEALKKRADATRRRYSHG